MKIVYHKIYHSTESNYFSFNKGPDTMYTVMHLENYTSLQEFWKRWVIYKVFMMPNTKINQKYCNAVSRPFSSHMTLKGPVSCVPNGSNK